MNKIIQKIKGIFQNKKHQLHIKMTIQNRSEVIEQINDVISKLKEAKLLADNLASIEIQTTVINPNQFEDQN